MATAADSPSNYGLWDLYFDVAGAYEVEVYVEAGSATSMQAPYQIRHDGLSSVHSLDQSSVDGWISLGEFAFEAGGEQWIRLDDNTGEDWQLDRALVYDAIRLTPMGGAGETETTGSEETSGETGSGSTSEDGGETAGNSTSEDAGLSAAPSDDGDDSEGCNCRADGERSAGLLWLFGPLVLWRRRRAVGTSL